MKGLEWSGDGSCRALPEQGGVADRRLTHPLHCVSSGLRLHGRLSQLLGQLPHPILHPLQEDLPQHHAGLGKGVLNAHTYTHTPKHTFKLLCLSLYQSAITAVSKGPKIPVSTRPHVCLDCCHIFAVGQDGLGPICLLTPSPTKDNLHMSVHKFLEEGRGLGSCGKETGDDGPPIQWAPGSLPGETEVQCNLRVLSWRICSLPWAHAHSNPSSSSG